MTDALTNEQEVDDDGLRRMRMHIWRTNCRMRELIAIMELRDQTPVAKSLIQECRELVTEGAKYE